MVFTSIVMRMLLIAKIAHEMITDPTHQFPSFLEQPLHIDSSPFLTYKVLRNPGVDLVVDLSIIRRLMVLYHPVSVCNLILPPITKRTAPTGI